VYQYHILFREFLLARARQTLSEECRAETWRAAAGLLEEAGQADDAVRLLTEAEDWTSLSALITRQAPAAFARGRGQTLLQWIERVPEHLRERDPWLLHWRAACRQLFDLRQSRQDSHRAFRLFRDLGNRAGAFRAWGQAVSSYLCELDDLAPLDGWVSDLEAMLAEEPAFPSREVEVAVTNSMLGALILRQPANPHLRGWAERTEALARELPGGDLHDQALLHLIAYHYWTGDMARALLLADTLGDSIRSRQGSPLVRLVVSVFITRLEWLQGRSNDLRAVRERIKAAQAWDAVPLRSLIAEAACASLSLGDRASAGEFLQQLGRVVGKAPPHDTAYYHFLVAWDAILVGDLTRALRHGEECVRLILQVGCPPVEALARGFLAQLLHESGEHDEGWASLALALDIARHSAYRVVLFPVLLTEAYLAFDHEDEERGLGALREGLALGRERGYFSTFGWRPAVLSRLCAKALEAGIEVEYVRDLIRKRGLVPEGLSAESEAWPWPVRVYALGRFDLLRDEQPVRFEGKAQRRPLGLLRALIAYGGQDVQEASLTDTLWPEAEGDAAAQALSTTIHRLRRLLRREEAILRQEGRVSLNRQVCWVDVWAFERLLIRAETVRAGGREEAWAQVLAWTRRAADLYRGPFLGSEGEAACAVPLAERLRQRWVNHLAAMARREGERGEWLRAVEWCEKGLESDPCAEVLYRGLMTAYAGLGRRSEALAIYQRCRKNLQAALEVGPSAETEEIFRRLRSA
jgi:DNA-binding SARP family transcriptional activator